MIFAWLTVAGLAGRSGRWAWARSTGCTAVVVGALFLLEAHAAGRPARARGEPLKPMRLFHWSTTYLTILFVAVAVDALSDRSPLCVATSVTPSNVRSSDVYHVACRIRAGSMRMPDLLRMTISVLIGTKFL